MPNEQKITRELRAILSADVNSYSLLMFDKNSIYFKLKETGK